MYQVEVEGIEAEIDEITGAAEELVGDTEADAISADDEDEDSA